MPSSLTAGPAKMGPIMADEPPTSEPERPPQKVSERIRKLLSLATSDNANEAASAAAKAQALMQEHKLTQADVELADSDETAITEIAMGAEGFMADWKFALVSHVARAFFCEAIGLRVKRRRKVRIVGRREDAQTAVTVFTYLVKEIERLAEKVTEVKNVYNMEEEGWDGVLSDVMDMMFGGTVDLREYREQWRQGAAHGAADKLKTQMARFAAQGDRALMVVSRSREAIESHLSTKYPKATQREVTPRMISDQVDQGLSSLAFEKGYAAGQRIDVSTGKDQKVDE